MPEHGILKHHQQPLVCSCSIMKETRFFLVKKHRKVDPHYAIDKALHRSHQTLNCCPMACDYPGHLAFQANRCRDESDL